MLFLLIKIESYLPPLSPWQVSVSKFDVPAQIMLEVIEP